jgi:ribosomal-protein-serine acetyltransferase
VSDRLPELLPGPGGLVLRRWLERDAHVIGEAVAQSVDHLRPWMPWIAQEPLSIVERRALIDKWERDWLSGGDVVMGAFVNGAVVGGCGLHHRIGPRGLEIGYWTHAAFLRMGMATSVAQLLIEAAFARAGITHVEIHHDKANVASGGVARKLGFQLVREVRDEIEAPSEIGVSCEWRLNRDRWTHLHAGPQPDGLS